jgi:hypothetical protein
VTCGTNAQEFAPAPTRLDPGVLWIEIVSGCSSPMQRVRPRTMQRAAGLAAERDEAAHDAAWHANARAGDSLHTAQCARRRPKPTSCCGAEGTVARGLGRGMSGITESA